MAWSAPELNNWIADHDPLHVVALDDVVVEAAGFPPDGRFAETYWLPVVGPSALWALRRLTGVLAAAPAGLVVPIDSLAAELGLGAHHRRQSPMVRALGRLVMFGLAEIVGDDLAVRRKVPPLAHRHLRRLPAHLVDAHRRHLETCAGSDPAKKTSHLRVVPPPRLTGTGTARLGVVEGERSGRGRPTATLATRVIEAAGGPLTEGPLRAC